VSGEWPVESPATKNSANTRRALNLIQITPGAGGMYCGNCFRDNALVAALRRMGHDVTMVPLYLPMTLDEEDQSSGTPIFFNGINVYLEQKSAFFRNAPEWLHKLFRSSFLLKLAGRQAGKTRAEDVSDLTISMLKGEEGNQARELSELITFLKSRPRKPDAITLSNAMLVGLARRLKSELACRIVCELQGEDAFLDSMKEPDRSLVWETMADRAGDVDLFVAPSRYFGETMARRLSLPMEKVAVVPNGINLDGYPTAPAQPPSDPPVLGYFARMCEEKGLHLLVETFINLKRREDMKSLRLRIGGGCGPGDEAFVARLKRHMKAEGVLDDVEFHPNLDRTEKIAFYHSLSVFCVPALYGESFGLYLIEAMAAGVPIVQPRHAAFPEILEESGAGLIAEANAGALADAVHKLLKTPGKHAACRNSGLDAVRARYNVDAMAEAFVSAMETRLPAGSN
jgi:glycosyltransferase involved in cell wall biosynthesis